LLTKEGEAATEKSRSFGAYSPQAMDKAQHNICATNRLLL